MLLVDDDHTQARQRGEDGEPGTDDDARLSAFCRPPSTHALTLGQVTVKGDQFCVGKSGAETFRELRSEVDLRNQHEGLLVATQRFGDDLEIHLGLAATRHTAQQERCVSA